RKLHRQKHDVLDRGLQIALTMRSDSYRLLTEQVECHRHIMRSKAPEGVFVLPDLPQIDAKSIQVEDLAEFALLYHLAQPFDGRMVHQEMADQHWHAPFGPLAGHRFGV